MTRKFFATLALLMAFCVNVLGQKITGVILDASTGDSLSLAGVTYKERKVSAIADLDGIFSIARINGATLTFSCMGYKDETVNITKATPSRLTIKLKPDTKQLGEVVVEAKRTRYVRKDNPAIELMKRVIEMKKSTKLENHDYYMYNKYQKLSMALNDYKVKELDSTDVGKVKWTQQAELSPYNKKMVVPISLDETVTQHIYRKDPKTEKDIITGEQSSGLNQLFATGEMINTTLKEVFQDVDIYDNYIKLLKFPFLSPIGAGATSFYRYYITDTVLVDRDSCYHLTFTPNNPQDIGFNGDIYILKDSTLHVKKCHLSIPKKSDVNFVSSLHIDQIYSQLPNEEWALTNDDMWAEMTLLGKSVLVVRNTRLSDYSFDPLHKNLFKGQAKVKRMADSRNQDEEFWDKYRAVELSQKEGGLGDFMTAMSKSKNMRIPLLVVKTLFENYIETSRAGKPSKFDIGPVISTFSSNFYDGFRLRAGGQTTAAFNKHLFLEGHYTHGFKSGGNYYGGQVTYCFNKKKNSYFEFPQRMIVFESSYDVTSVSDKFLKNSKDNLFVNFKTETVNMLYKQNMQRLGFVWETDYGLNFTTNIVAESNRPVGDLHLVHVNDGTEDYRMRTTEWNAAVTFCPGQTYINTKQDRWPINKDRPEFTIRHAIDFKGILGGQFAANQTEVGIFKRQWLGSWGRIDLYASGAIQWNKVPFPLLITPPTCISYVEQEGTLNMLRNMEFFMDRRVFWSVSWNMNGKIFNRIPLFKKLKLREYLAFRGVWGTLTDKNNPLLNAGDDMLYQFPEGSYAIDGSKPYMEVAVGIRNILKVFGVDYVRRLNYFDHPGVKKNGVRFNLTFSF
ncbi:MAG: carboxypeptidase-like regulatory domain-containing protein [Bacteroidaceae bacterium]|nr:carboxypeptidase-like regulatory domain-containing protein [Bacteroidaceae bacterium]